MGNPCHYACLELKTPGTYIIDLNCSAPPAGHQDKHEDDKPDAKVIEMSKYHLKETMFHHSARCEIEVKERIDRE